MVRSLRMAILLLSVHILPYQCLLHLHIVMHMGTRLTKRLAYLLAICMSSLEKCLFSLTPIFLLHFFFKLSCRSYLYILEINPLSVTSFANILSHFEGCLLLLFMVSFAMQKLLRIIKPYLFIFVFAFITLGKWSHSVVSYSLRPQGL